METTVFKQIKELFRMNVGKLREKYIEVFGKQTRSFHKGPCCLNSKDPCGKDGGCGATIDTIMACNFACNVATGGAAHTSHGMASLRSGVIFLRGFLESCFFC